MSQVVGYLEAIERSNAQTSISTAAMARLAYHADKNEWKKGIAGASQLGKLKRPH